jgi:hypothetical protein
MMHRLPENYISMMYQILQDLRSSQALIILKWTIVL